eukprot:tig00000254_g22566.t1
MRSFKDDMPWEEMLRELDSDEGFHLLAPVALKYKAHLEGCRSDARVVRVSSEKDLREMCRYLADNNRHDIEVVVAGSWQC